MFNPPIVSLNSNPLRFGVLSTANIILAALIAPTKSHPGIVITAIVVEMRQRLQILLRNTVLRRCILGMGVMMVCWDYTHCCSAISEYVIGVQRWWMTLISTLFIFCWVILYRHKFTSDYSPAGTMTAFLSFCTCTTMSGPWKYSTLVNTSWSRSPG